MIGTACASGESRRESLCFPSDPHPTFDAEQMRWVSPRDLEARAEDDVQEEEASEEVTPEPEAAAEAEPEHTSAGGGCRCGATGRADATWLLLLVFAFRRRRLSS